MSKKAQPNALTVEELEQQEREIELEMESILKSYDQELEALGIVLNEAREAVEKAIEARRSKEREKWRKHGEASSRLVQTVRMRLELEEGVRGYPSAKLDKLWMRAWEEGHSSGLSEVENVYRGLVELIKD